MILDHCTGEIPVLWCVILHSITRRGGKKMKQTIEQIEQEIVDMHKIADQLTFHSDPGHGWLAVPWKIFWDVQGIASAYSYVNKEYVFLEEDCDAYPIVEKITKKFGWNTTEFFKMIKEEYQENTFVRNLSRY